MEQHTLVAFYGKKPEGLANLVHFIWEKILQSSLKDFFIPYVMDQIHATLVGMEKIPGFSQAYNLNIWEKKGTQKQMNISGLEDTLVSFFPAKIQFGGFQEEDAQVKSFGQPLFDRSFHIDWQSGRVVLIGWPIDVDGQVATTLLRLREALFQNHRILHKYEGDNDCYLVLGSLTKLDQLDTLAISNYKSEQQVLEKDIRAYMSGCPHQIRLELNDLSVVKYTDSTLPLSSSKSYTLEKVNELFK